MNEISKICDLVGIRTADVLAAARTKWNFLGFYPGLVGGHCIGVDPYYLTAKAQALGYHPEVILSGRRINDTMGSYVAQKAIQRLAAGERPLSRIRAGVLGVTFKENVQDVRNSKVFDILDELARYAIRPLVHDPLADAEQVLRDHDIRFSPLEAFADLDLLILAVAHDHYAGLTAEAISAMIAPGGVLIDLKSRYEPGLVREDIRYWSL
jgi:UDP-N-acetyl-D-glucosamine/UDP-N-acetyl-D-galactosamine dehydrogenase